MRVSDNVLEVEDLKTYFYVDEGTLKALDGVSFEIGKQETLGVIGESGCGKSVTARSILRIVPAPGKTVGGTANLYTNGDAPKDLLQMKPSGEAIRAIRGKEISMIFQEPMTSLSPVHTVGNQIEEAILLHITKDKGEAHKIALDMIDRVGIPNPPMMIKSYPHQLSGGLRQRMMIAMALSCNPKLLIADEPTTALDVTVQAQILELIKELQVEFGMSVMFITHDLGVIASVADRVAVMYLGRVVESAPVKELFRNPMHPYTTNLLKSVPRVGKERGKRLQAIRGMVPTPLNLPRQCPFMARCDQAMPGVCDKAMPELVSVTENHAVRCYLHHDKDEPVAASA
jgi:oligopeptide/dipeptide ABC transporter ATP-binding protein